MGNLYPRLLISSPHHPFLPPHPLIHLIHALFSQTCADSSRQNSLRERMFRDSPSP